jgi:peptide chain release factor 1
MIDALNSIVKEYDELTEKVSDPDIISNQALYKKYSKRRVQISRTVELAKELEKVIKTKQDAEGIMKDTDDADMIELAEQELDEAKKREEEVREELQVELLPKDPNEAKDCIIEIRPGAGGDEASIFVGELSRMYMRYAEEKGLKIELMSENIAESGGFKEIIFAVRGDGAYGEMQYESGVHRVQRIPVTESKGRVHTSTVTVAVLAEAEEEEVEIDPNDLRIDVYRASGKGGQSVNTTDSAVRITHVPTGIVVAMQDEKSQLKNKDKGMKVLYARVKALEEEKRIKDASDKRVSQIGTGDRSEKIRTYNFPQDRVTDHRIKVNFSNLPGIMEGDIEQIITKLREEDQSRKMSEFAV